MIADERNGDAEPRRAIDFIPAYNRYSDRVEEEAEEDGHAPSRAIEQGSHPAFPANVGREQQPSVENEWARG